MLILNLVLSLLGPVEFLAFVFQQKLLTEPHIRMVPEVPSLNHWPPCVLHYEPLHIVLLWSLD